MPRIFFSFLLILMAHQASAQHVYKCVDGKSVSYQSDPCTNGDAAKSWAAVPEAENPYLKARLDRMQREVDARRAAGSGSYNASPRSRDASGASITTSSNYACESAKRQRAAAYEAAGTKRTFELSRRMDNLVHDACK